MGVRVVFVQRGRELFSELARFRRYALVFDVLFLEQRRVLLDVSENLGETVLQAFRLLLLAGQLVLEVDVVGVDLGVAAAALLQPAREVGGGAEPWEQAARRCPPCP